MESNEPRGLSRRTVAKGAAWAVPTVAVLGVAPASAASGGVTPVCNNGTCFTGDAWKLPGGSCHVADIKQGYVFGMTTQNPTTSCVFVQVTSMTVNTKTYNAGNTSLQVVQLSGPGCTGPACSGVTTGYSIAVAAGTTVSWDVIFGQNGNSANGTASITYVAYSADDCSQVAAMSGSLTTNVNSLSPGPCP